MTQRVVAFREHGAPSVLEVIEVPEPHAASGQVRVRMRAAGIQPFDCAFRRGDLAGFMAASFPQGLGNDFAGVIDEVGDGVDALTRGDEVLGFCTLQAHAELIVVDAADVVSRPAGLPWPVAGGLSASGQTALNALRDLNVRAGDTLLVHAAAGGVGTVAVQLARQWGATVIGTASPGNHEHLAAWGITPSLTATASSTESGIWHPPALTSCSTAPVGTPSPSHSSSGSTAPASGPWPTTARCRSTACDDPEVNATQRTWPSSSSCTPTAPCTCRSTSRHHWPTPPARTPQSRPDTYAARSS